MKNKRKEQQEGCKCRIASSLLIHKKVTKGIQGITLIALVVTTIFSYDENVKSSNNKGFLL